MNLILIEKINAQIVHASPKFSFGDTPEYNRFRLLRTINVPSQVEKPAYCTMLINKFATSSGDRKINMQIVHASPKFSFGDTSQYNRFRLLRTINIPIQVEKPAYCTMLINKFVISSGARSMNYVDKQVCDIKRYKKYEKQRLSHPQKSLLAD